MKKQSVTLTNGELIDCANMLSALLESKPVLGILQGFPLEQNIRVMQIEATEVWNARNGIIEKHTQRGEDGKPLTAKVLRLDSNGAPKLDADGKAIIIGEKYVFSSPEAQAEAEKEIADLNGIQTKLDLYRLPFDSFTVFGEQPISWSSLRPIIEEED